MVSIRSGPLSVLDLFQIHRFHKNYQATPWKRQAIQAKMKKLMHVLLAVNGSKTGFWMNFSLRYIWVYLPWASYICLCLAAHYPHELNPLPSFHYYPWDRLTGFSVPKIIRRKRLFGKTHPHTAIDKKGRESVHVIFVQSFIVLIISAELLYIIHYDLFIGIIMEV